MVHILAATTVYQIFDTGGRWKAKIDSREKQVNLWNFNFRLHQLAIKSQTHLANMHSHKRWFCVSTEASHLSQDGLIPAILEERSCLVGSTPH